MFYLFFRLPPCSSERRKLFSCVGALAEEKNIIILFSDIEWNRRVTCAVSNKNVDVALRTIFVHYFVNCEHSRRVTRFD